jgi:enediyne biosynthesis protein E4
MTVAAAVLLLAGCRSAPSEPGEPDAPSGADLPAGDLFIDATEGSGLSFVHFNGMTGEFLYPEVMAPGVGLLDYDNDGDLDVFVVQGRMLGGHPVSRALVPPEGPLKGRLYRNDGVSGGIVRFTDVTEASGIVADGYGMGVAVGDFDNDGCVDLYVTNLGPGMLFRNGCDGTFTDVTARSGTASPGWGVSAAFVDYDRDGWLDLFVGHYLNYTVGTNIRCHSASGLLDYCPPHVYRALPSRLYRNNRDGTFRDVTEAAGMALDFGPAMGVSTADFDGDGWIDIYVANDSTANGLWINNRDGTFRNTAWIAGAAVGPDGQPKASMGVDAGDFDNDGDEDIFITELTTQGADLYVNDGTGVFTDESARAGLRVPTLPFTGFGTAWFDFDNDGWLDLATVNGLVTHRDESLAAGDWFGLRQRRQLLRNVQGRFEDISARAGPAFMMEEVGRGAAFGDLDNDGDTDIVVANDAGPVRILLNQTGSRQAWAGLRLVGSVSGGRPGAERDMLGARVRITRGDGLVLWRRVRTDGSYGSANDPRIIAGLGPSDTPPRVSVYWPGGRVEEWSDIPVGRYTTLREGSGTPVQETASP